MDYTANRCEVVVSFLHLTEVFAGGGLLSATCCCLLEVAMVLEIRRGLTGWRYAKLRRDIVVTFRRHRRFYPGSPLRAAFVASSCLLGCSHRRANHCSPRNARIVEMFQRGLACKTDPNWLVDQIKASQEMELSNG